MLLTVVQLEKTCFPMTVSTLSANGAVRHPLHGPGADVWCILSTARDMTIDSRIFLTYFQLMRSGRTVKCSAQAHNTWTAVWYRATITSFVCLCECVALPLTSLSTARDFCWHEKFCVIHSSQATLIHSLSWCIWSRLPARYPAESFSLHKKGCQGHPGKISKT